MCYEELDSSIEYLDLSQRNLGLEGVLDILHDISEDRVIKQVNLSYNIPLEDVMDPKRVEYFIGKFKKYVSRNTTLTALDLAGNHLFHFHPHPSNDHTRSYEKEITEALKVTKITHIDLSENNIAGFKGRELDGFLYFLNKFMVSKKALQLRRSNLNSQGFLTLVHCLGVKSSLTYLDVSDNLRGLDPLGRNSSEGIQVFARVLSQTPFLRVLKIARNFLRDDDADHISQALQFMPGFEDLDISGNMLHYFSCRGVQKAICSHAISSYNPNDPTKRPGGFRSLDMSNNDLGDAGVKELCFALQRTKVLQRLTLQHCKITDVGANQLINILRENSTLMALDVENNLMSHEFAVAIQAEVETNRLLISLRKDHMAVNCNALAFETYHALLRKLRYLNDEQLKVLHLNPSFTTPGADMTEALFLLSPPPRQYLVEEVKRNNSALVARLEKSRAIAKKVDATLKVGRTTLSWFRRLKQRRRMHYLTNIATKMLVADRELRAQYDHSFVSGEGEEGEEGEEGSSSQVADIDPEAGGDDGSNSSSVG